MSKRFLSLFCVVALTLAACNPVSGPGDSGAFQDEAMCPAAQHADLVGQKIDAVTFDWPTAKQRIVYENDPITLDFRADRMTVVHDDEGTILSISCT